MEKWSQQDLAQIKNILVALNRAEYKLQGEEILAFGQAVRWISSLHDKVTQSLKPTPISPLNTIAKLTTKPEDKKSGKKKHK